MLPATEVRRHRRAANCGGFCICFLCIGSSATVQSIAMMSIDSITSCHTRKGLIDEDLTSQEMFPGRFKLLGKMSTRPAPNLGVQLPPSWPFQPPPLHELTSFCCIGHPNMLTSCPNVPGVPCFCQVQLNPIAFASGVRAAPKLRGIRQHS